MSNDRGPAAKRVLLFGGYDRTKVSRIAAMAQGLVAHGLTVEECNAPLQFPHDARVRLVRRPWTTFQLVAALARCWTQLLRLCRPMQTPDLVLVPYPAQLDVMLAGVRFPRSLIAVDLMVFLGDTVKDRRGLSFVAWGAGVLDRLSIRAADIVILDTEEHRSMVPRSQQHKCVVVPVGAPEEWFSPTPGEDLVADDRPIRIIFFGLFTPLQGTLTIADAFALLEGAGIAFSATVIGTGQDSAEFDRRIQGLRSVRRVDWLDEESLRRETQSHDICLGIFGTTPKALRVVPQKIALGAASGCALVTSRTGPQERFLRDSAVLVPPGDEVALAQELEKLARDRGRLKEMKERAIREGQTRFAPKAIAGPLVAAIREDA